MPDHVHIMISIPPKYSVAQIKGYINGKSAIQIARRYGSQKHNLWVCAFGPVDIMFQQLVGTRI